MTTNRLKQIALGFACYAAGMYLLKMANSKLNTLVDDGFKWV